MPELQLQRKLAAQILKCGLDRVYFNPENLKEIKEAITKSSINDLIKSGIIKKIPPNPYSRRIAIERARARRKRRRCGHGSRQGGKKARGAAGKSYWIPRVRALRALAKKLKPKIEKKIYNEIKLKIKGGFFRSRNHLLLWLKKLGALK